MKANELIRQYHAKTITARELVEGVWKHYVEWQQVTPERGVLNGFGEIYHGAVDTFPQPESAAWAKAADFTISRIEEIQQVKEEIALLRGLVILLNEEPGDLSTPAWLRVITREQAALAELSRGVRPEVLNGTR